ncbi:MAG TPA: hypothetical protein VF443_12945 [Nitrospira sp.]|jgi:hypothetical protein
MSQHADIVAIHYPRGVTALVWFDLETGTISTSHAGLQAALHQGVRNWDGRLVRSDEGRVFLSAVYDHFFLSGYSVHWLSLSGLKEVGTTYRV